MKGTAPDQADVEADAQDVEATVGDPVVKRRGRSAFASISRQVTDDDLAHSGVQRVLLDYMDQLVEETDELRSYRDRYHAADKEAAIVKTQLAESRQRKKMEELLGGIGLTIGGALLGIAPSLDKHGWVVGIASLALVVSVPLVVGMTRRSDVRGATNEG